jgi:signal transduction histidine kinase
VRAHLALVTARCAALVVALLVSGVAWYAWSDHRAAVAAERQRQVDLLTAVLAVTTDQDALRAAVSRAGAGGRIAVHLPDGNRVGTSRAAAEQVDAARSGGRAATVATAYGHSTLYPVRASGGGLAVIEIGRAAGGVDRHFVAVVLGFAALGLLAAGLAVLAADRMTAPVLRRLRGLGTETAAGEAADDVAELAAIRGRIGRVDEMARQLVAREKQMIADVSHRLRTPLTALRLDADAVSAGPVADRIRSAVINLERDVNDIILAASRAAEPVRPPSTSCDLPAVVRHRMQFWQVPAQTQSRRCEVSCPDGPGLVELAERTVAEILDTLVGNVFQHTEPGTPLAVTVGRHDGWVTLVVDDGGPGIADPEAALRRGVSGGGSTGLGLDIARNGVEATGGTIHLERSRLGGARIRLRFAEAGRGHGRQAPRALRLLPGRSRRRC